MLFDNLNKRDFFVSVREVTLVEEKTLKGSLAEFSSKSWSLLEYVKRRHELKRLDCTSLSIESNTSKYTSSYIIFKIKIL